METGLLAILTFFIATKASEITSKTFGKFAVSDYTSLNVKNNVASRLRCASMCSGVQNSGCVAYVYELSTKICNMYSFVQIMPQAQGVLSAYVDISACYPPPYVAAAVYVTSWNVSSGATTATYHVYCDPDLYITMTAPTVTCPWSTGQWPNFSYTCIGAWACSPYNDADWEQLDAGQAEDLVCMGGGRRFTYGYQNRAPGCGVCWCCRRV